MSLRCNRNMKGLNSLRALYLFEKKAKLKALENESSEYDDSFKEKIYNLRCGPDEIKKEYNKNSLIKAKKI